MQYDITINTIHCKTKVFSFNLKNLAGHNWHKQFVQWQFQLEHKHWRHGQSFYGHHLSEALLLCNDFWIVRCLFKFWWIWWRINYCLVHYFTMTHILSYVLITDTYHFRPLNEYSWDLLNSARSNKSRIPRDQPYQDLLFPIPVHQYYHDKYLI